MQPEWMLGEAPSISNGKISDGSKGNEQTIQIMREIALSRAGNPIIRELALNIIRMNRVGSHDFIDEARAIGEYVKEKVHYIRDPAGIEQLHDPLLMIDRIRAGRGYGDCDDMSLLIATLLLSIGAQPYFRAIKYNSVLGNFNHIYVVVYDRNYKSGDKRLVIDAIIKDKPIGTEVRHKYGIEVEV